jgi:hypothetical protein
MSFRQLSIVASLKRDLQKLGIASFHELEDVRGQDAEKSQGSGLACSNPTL